MARFTVVSMVREDLAVLEVFCRHYLRAGADRIVLYFDGSRDEAAEIAGLSDLGPVEVIACDAEFWADHPGGRPEIVSDRQCAAFERTYATCTTDWMLPCDADELLIVPRPLEDWLDEIPADIEAVKFPTAEAVWGPGDDPDRAFGTRYFRLAFPDFEVWRRKRYEIYGFVGGLMKSGVAGHELGKYIMRTGRSDLRIQIHRVNRAGKDVSVPVCDLRPEEDMVYLGHFDAISFSRWSRKLQRFGRRGKKLSKVRGRRRYLRMLVYRLAHFGPGPQKWLFRRLYCLSSRQIEQLSSLGLVIERDVVDVES